MISSLEIQNLTAFDELKMEFSPGINVIIGENGTGKTHLLKALHALCVATSLEGPTAERRAAATEKLLRLFLPIDGKLKQLCHDGADSHSRIEIRSPNDEVYSMDFSSRSQRVELNTPAYAVAPLGESVFIPTKEVLSLVQGMNHADHCQRTIDMVFDDSYLDLAAHLRQPGIEDEDARIDLDPRFGTILPELVKLVGGRYRWRADEGFLFQPGKYEERSTGSGNATTDFQRASANPFSCALTAEGYRKVGILQRILSNKTLNPGSGGPLLWDEPESNVNPKLMKVLVEVLLELGRNGQQVILATHDYILLKWFDVLSSTAQGDETRYHVLHRDEDHTVSCRSSQRYVDLEPNAIADTFLEITTTLVQKNMGEVGR